MTRQSTSGESYVTRASTSGTSYGTKEGNKDWYYSSRGYENNSNVRIDQLFSYGTSFSSFSKVLIANMETYLRFAYAYNSAKFTFSRYLSYLTVNGAAQTYSYLSVDNWATIAEFESTSPLKTLSNLRAPITITATARYQRYYYNTLSYTAGKQTTGTTYLTRSSTSGTIYLTRTSTSGYSGISSSSTWE